MVLICRISAIATFQSEVMTHLLEVANEPDIGLIVYMACSLYESFGPSSPLLPLRLRRRGIGGMGGRLAEYSVSRGMRIWGGVDGASVAGL